MTNRPTRLMALASLACVALATWGLAAKPAQAQPAAPAQVAPDYSSTSGVIPWSAIMEKPLSGMANPVLRNAAGAQGSSEGGTDASKGAGNASHEELSRANLRESIREFNEGDGAVKKPDSAQPNSTANPLRKSVSSAAGKAAQQSNRDQWAAISLRDEMINDALPWVYGLAGLLAVGFAVKVWLNNMQAKAARPGMRRRAARKRSRRSSGSSGSSSSSSSLEGTDGSSSRSSSSSSGRRRHRAHRPQL